MLRALRSEPRRPASLTAAVDATRTTIQRILSGFRERDWVVKRGAAYHVTPTGKRVHDAYEELLDEVELADRYGQFAADLERVGADFPPSALDTGELTVAADRNPLAAVDRLTELLREGAARKSAPSRPSSSSSSTMPRQRRSTRALRSNSLSTATWSRNRSRSSARRPIGRSTTTARRCTSPRTDRIRGLPVRRSRVRDRLRQQKQPRCVLESTDSGVVDWVDDKFESFVAEAQCLSGVVENT